MLDFEKLNGFIVDLTTEELVNEEYDNIKENLDSDITSKTYDWKEKREIIVEYYVFNYEYVFMKAPNVLFMCEEDLKEVR